MAKPDKKDAQTAAQSSAVMVEITCPSGPRRRAGMNFGPTPVTINASELTGEQQQMLEGDALLVFRRADETTETSSAE